MIANAKQIIGWMAEDDVMALSCKPITLLAINYEMSLQTVLSANNQT